jgi:DNA polymerase I
MSDRTLVIAAVNLLERGYQVVPIDRKSPAGVPVNALFAVARAIQRVMAFKTPARAVAVIEAEPRTSAWPEILKAQLGRLPELLRALSVPVVEAKGEADVVASYAHAALEAGDDVIVVGVDKRYAQLVSERLWWYDANKDVRYTPEIVQKRFGVPAARVGEWLALVGDDSGNDPLPGVKGLGAKGVTTLIEEHGSVGAALAKLDALPGRLGKLLRGAQQDVERELGRGRLDPTRPLPTPRDHDAGRGLSYVAPDTKLVNTLYEQLGFAELLAADAVSIRVELCQARGEALAALARLGASDAASPEPIALHALIDDAGPGRAAISGIALSNGRGGAAYVPFASAAWAELAVWLGDPSAPKVGHDVVGTLVELRRTGVVLQGVVGDSACASHLAESSNWAPHDLPIVAKHVLGRALPEEDAIAGVGKQRRAWHAIELGRVAEYAAILADASGAIWHKLAPSLEPKSLLGEYLEIEELCARMELTGILVDPAELDQAELAFAAIEAELDTEIEALAGHAFNIGSAKQLGAVLFQELKLPVASHTKTGWSTSIEALERIEHAHPIVPLVLRWRALRRLRDNWVIALRRCIGADGRVHSRFYPARSFSGQLVNMNPDLGRVPGRTPEMARIRRAFVAAPGRLLMSVDFNQLGLHVLAHLSGDPALAEPLRQRADMHRLTAAAVLDLPPEQISVEQRQLGKVINFATFAGQGASALALMLGISAAEAKQYIARFDRHYSKVRAFQDEQLRAAREQGHIVTLAGRRWPIGGLESLDPQARSYAERLARRATHEASVQDVSRRALLEADRAIAREGLGALPVLQILDEVLFDVPEAQLTTAARVCSQAMRHAFELDVPLVVGVEAGKNWADLEPLSVSP